VCWGFVWRGGARRLRQRSVGRQTEPLAGLVLVVGFVAAALTGSGPSAGLRGWAPRRRWWRGAFGSGPFARCVGGCRSAATTCSRAMRRLQRRPTDHWVQFGLPRTRQGETSRQRFDPRKTGRNGSETGSPSCSRLSRPGDVGHGACIVLAPGATVGLSGGRARRDFRSPAGPRALRPFRRGCPRQNGRKRGSDVGRARACAGLFRGKTPRKVRRKRPNRRCFGNSLLIRWL